MDASGEAAIVRGWNDGKDEADRGRGVQGERHGLRSEMRDQTKREGHMNRDQTPQGPSERQRRRQ
eukprot:3635223-Pleurochrysis_carterae.AAC.2